MKKVMTVFLAAGLMFAVAGKVSAAPLETSGEYRARFWDLENYAQVAAAQANQEFWDQRLRMKMAWKVNDTVMLNARADILEYVWDTVTNEATTQSEIDFDWAWADIGINANTRLQLGKMDVSWGPGVYAKADNRYRARIASKFGDIPVAFAYDKMNEQHLDAGVPHEEDWNGYTLGAIFPVGSWKFGVLGVYSDNNPADTNLLGLDLTADGMLGPAKIVFEGAYGQGDAKNALGNGIDQEGLMGYLGAFLPLGPVSCGFELGYAQGDDPGTADFEGALFHDYNGPFNSFILFNNFDLDGWNSVYSGGADKGLNNALALKASGTFAFNKQFSLMGALVWAQADQVVSGRDDDMGVEGDLLAKFALNENVTLLGGFGYLAAGDYFGKNLDDPWVATAQAIVAF
jgi:hypothetical protein